MTNWAEVRACLLGEFRPHALTEAGPAAARLWDELKVVSTVNAWRSTSALAGQLLELLLKQAVIDRGGSRRFAREPLGPVLAEANDWGSSHHPPRLSPSPALSMRRRNFATSRPTAARGNRRTRNAARHIHWSFSYSSPATCIHGRSSKGYLLARIHRSTSVRCSILLRTTLYRRPARP